MTVTYEWDIETVDPDTDDILDHRHADKLSELPKPGTNERLVLVRDDDAGRSWAYVKNGILPNFFSIPEADGNEYETAVAVPVRFEQEFNRWKATP